VQDLTIGQPLSVPVAATARPGAKLHMSSWATRPRATAAVALNGDEQDMALLYHSAPEVTDVPTEASGYPKGVNKGGLTDTVTSPSRQGHDRLSLVPNWCAPTNGFPGSTRSSCPPPRRHPQLETCSPTTPVEQNHRNAARTSSTAVWCSSGKALRGKPNGHDNVKPRPGPSHRTRPRGNATSIRRSTAGRASGQLSVQRLP